MIGLDPRSKRSTMVLLWRPSSELYANFRPYFSGIIADIQANVHRMHHDPSRIQLCTLMNIKSESARKSEN
jgi:hypothetical protein